MNEEKVDVSQTPCLILGLGHFQSMLRMMVVVPELCGDEDVFPLDDAFFDCATDPLASFGLVLIVVRTIEETIADFDGLHSEVSSCAPPLPLATLLTLYTISAALLAGTFQRPKPTRGICWPEASLTVR